MSDVDQIISIRQRLSNIWEADELPSSPPTAPEPGMPAPAMPEQPPIDQAQLDRDIDDVMTTPKMVSADDEEITAVADDLGVEDTDAFVKAFDNLRAETTGDDMDGAAIISAFQRLMGADASTVQKSINRLRDIYDRPIKADSATD